MEHVASGVPLERGDVDRPRWRTLAWELVLGYVFVYAVLVPVLFGLKWLELAAGGSALAYRPSGVAQFPFVANGAWSLTANLFWTVALTLLCAFAVWGCLRARLERPVSFAGVLAAVTLGGYVPAADPPGLGAAQWPVQFGVALVLVRWLAVGRALPFRVPAVAVAAALALLLPWALVAAAYGVAHPVSLATGVAGAPTAGKEAWHETPPVNVFAARPGAHAEHSFAVENRGFADVRVTAVRLPAGAPFALAGLSEGPADGGPPGWSAVARDTSGRFLIPARESRWLVLRLEALACRPVPHDSLRRVLVDYELFGRRWTQPVPLIPAPAARCAAGS